MVVAVKSFFRFKKISIFVGFFSLYLIADYTYFLMICRKYAAQSAKSIESLPPTLEKEMIVVLTGDRKRIPAALDLLRGRSSSLLLISGAGRGATLTDLVNSQEAQAARVREVWNQILVESKSTSTIENARESGKIISKHGIHRVVLVTSDYHMHRSLLTFQTMSGGPEYIAFAVPSEFALLLQGEITNIVPALFKVTVEYWKYFVFRNYFLNHLYDEIAM